MFGVLTDVAIISEYMYCMYAWPIIFAKTYNLSDMLQLFLSSLSESH